MSKDKKEGSRRLDRRRFLKGAGLAIGAASATSAVAADGVAVPDKNKPQHTGYRETEAVRTYYRVARI